MESDDNQLTSYITQMEPTYQNWNYGQPVDKYKGARCTVWRSNDGGENGDGKLDPGWSSTRCGDRFHRVCMKRG